MINIQTTQECKPPECEPVSLEPVSSIDTSGTLTTAITSGGSAAYAVNTRVNRMDSVVIILALLLLVQLFRWMTEMTGLYNYIKTDKDTVKHEHVWITNEGKRINSNEVMNEIRDQQRKAEQS